MTALITDKGAKKGYDANYMVDAANSVNANSVNAHSVNSQAVIPPRSYDKELYKKRSLT